VSSDTVATVLDTFAKKNLSFAPVVNELSGKVIGLIGISDIVAGILQIVDRTASNASDELIQKGQNFSSLPVRYLIDLSKMNPFRIIEVGESVLKAMEMMAKEGNLKVIIVVDDLGEPLGVITQSMIIRFIAENINIIGKEVLEKSANILDIVHPHVIQKVNLCESFIKVFDLLKESSIPTVAVVNNDDVVVAWMSIEDFKGFTEIREYLLNLIKPVGEVLMTHRSSQTSEPTSTCQSSDTLDYIILKFATTHCPYMWIVNEDPKKVPKGVVSLNDVFKVIKSIE